MMLRSPQTPVLRHHGPGGVLHRRQLSPGDGLFPAAAGAPAGPGQRGQGQPAVHPGEMVPGPGDFAGGHLLPAAGGLPADGPAVCPAAGRRYRAGSMKNMRFGFEESDEENNDMNPDWEDAFEKSGLGDKLREMNELQLEGADVYMSTFAALKNYPFFREVHNWFYPFSKQQSNVLKAMKQAGNQGGSLLDLILQSGFFSNSDKYSLFFTIHQLPQSQQDMMLSQLNEQQVAELAEKSNVETMKKFNERPGTVSNQYLHDLYRFFKLSVRILQNLNRIQPGRAAGPGAGSCSINSPARRPGPEKYRGSPRFSGYYIMGKRKSL